MKEAKGGGRNIQEGIGGRLGPAAASRLSYRLEPCLGRTSEHYVMGHSRTTRNNKL